MYRRDFLRLSFAAPLIAQEGPPAEQRVEKLTAPPTPVIALNHLGFKAGARKILVCRVTSGTAPDEFVVRDIASYPKPFQMRYPLRRAASDLGECVAGEFTDIARRGMYQITVGAERSVPFFIDADIWHRTLPRAVNYYRQQRCGVAVPNVHPACHLDDARRRDNGERVDTTGGWHDAGDLRKWMSATMMNGIALLKLARNLGDHWDLAGAGVRSLLEEAAWGNRYFLKMQDTDGLVWNDVAGGVNGDNSDNHWTDNKPGTSDDRYINTDKGGRVQAMFTALQAMMAQAFRSANATYADRCLVAGERCWRAATRGAGALELGFWTMAALELHRATGRDEFATAAVARGRQLLGLQETAFVADQKRVRGFWRTSPSNAAPLVDAVHSALPPLALAELSAVFPRHQDATRWRDAVRLYIEEYVLPLTSLNAYAIMPCGVFQGSPTPERYRGLAGGLTYRYFLPVRKQFWWAGTTSHLESHALLLATGAKMFTQRRYADLAYRQLEWIMGANPFGACLMTGVGMRHPYPHSRFVGLIDGGILNGIAGNVDDEPVLDTANGYDWRTTEYWSPHNAYYIWANSVLESL
jgi:hypothetical protein